MGGVFCAIFTISMNYHLVHVYIDILMTTGVLLLKIKYLFFCRPPDVGKEIPNEGANQHHHYHHRLQLD